MGGKDFILHFINEPNKLNNMSETTTYPHEDLITDNKVNVADLPEKTRKLLEKFKAETDADKKDALDETLYGQIDDFLEAQAEKAKQAKVKEKVDAHKAKKKEKKPLDVSGAATAGGQQPHSGPGQQQASKERSAMSIILGRSN